MFKPIKNRPVHSSGLFLIQLYKTYLSILTGYGVNGYWPRATPELTIFVSKQNAPACSGWGVLLWIAVGQSASRRPLHEANSGNHAALLRWQVSAVGEPGLVG